MGLERFGSILGVVPLRNGGFVLQTLAEVPPFVVVDSAGVLVGRIGAPWDGFNRLHPLARSLTVASEPGSDTWAAGFTLGDGWFVVDGAVPRKILYPYATHVEFPAVTVDSSKMQVTAELTRADIVAWTAAISGGVLTVLSEDSVSKIADRYALKGGSYLGSVRLGRRDRAIGARGDTVFVLDGAGRLVVLRVGAPARPARNQRR